MGKNVDPLSQLNRSGFPFQLRVEHEILNTQQEHGWSVLSREHAWANPDTGASGFIDLVLEHNQYPTFRLVLECKRNRAEDARLLRWLFLLPDQEPKPTLVASCYEVERGDLRIWDNVSLYPASLQSEFCILHSDESRRQSILESLSSEVLESIEGLAVEEVNVAKSQDYRHLRLFIFPSIVTNAEIAVCRFQSSDINITDGTLDASNVEISTVPFIRFRKSLTTAFPEGRFFSVKWANMARARTVFVVNAASLPEFLKNWDIGPLHNGQYAIQLIER
jgi:hypothetical protein